MIFNLFKGPVTVIPTVIPRASVCRSKSRIGSIFAGLIKVVLMLEECGLDYDLRHVAVFAGEQFDPAFLAKNPLGEECYASPAVAHGNLFLRTLNHLWCIGEKRP